MENKRLYLKTNEFLTVGDHIVSKNGLFFAVMQKDGRFCIYRGTSPTENSGVIWRTRPETEIFPPRYFAIQQDDGNFCVYRGADPRHKIVKEALWCSKIHPGKGEYYAIVEDDGNFCVYRGTGPEDLRGSVWCSNEKDPLVDIEIISIDYDLKVAEKKSRSHQLLEQVLENEGDETQSTEISGSESVTETSGWSESVSKKVGAKTSFQVGIPKIGVGGSVELSIEKTYTYEWNGTTSKSRVWSFRTPMIVPPHRTMKCLVSVTLTELSVPYTLKGIALLNSGTKLSIQTIGMYTGTVSHDVKVTFIKEDPVTHEIESTTQEITNAISKIIVK